MMHPAMFQRRGGGGGGGWSPKPKTCVPKMDLQQISFFATIKSGGSRGARRSKEAPHMQVFICICSDGSTPSFSFFFPTETIEDAA